MRRTDRLGDRAVHATLWSGLEGLGRALLQFAITVVLARLLTPADFGVAAILALFTAVASVIADLGLTTYLVRNPHLEDPEASTAFFASIAVGVACAGMLTVCGPLLSRFFRAPALDEMLAVVSLSLVVGVTGSVHAALLARRLEFRRLSGAGIASLLAGGTVAVALALAGFGAWSLVWQSLVQAFVFTALVWFLESWRPQLRWSRTALVHMLGFGLPWMLARMLDAGFSRAHAAFLGRSFDVTAVGLFDRARAIQQLPANLLTGVVSRVALPVFAHARQKPDIARGMEAASRVLMFLNAPLMAGLAATADDAIVLLFGANWLAAAHPMRILCLAGLLWPLQAMNVAALTALGHTGLLLRMELPKKGFAVAALAIASLYGIEAVAWSFVASAMVALAVNSHYAARILGAGPLAQARAVWRSVAASFVMFAAVLAIDNVHTLAEPLYRLLLAVAVAVPVYAASCFLLGEPLVRVVLRARSLADLLHATLKTSTGTSQDHQVTRG